MMSGVVCVCVCVCVSVCVCVCLCVYFCIHLLLTNYDYYTGMQLCNYFPDDVWCSVCIFVFI